MTARFALLLLALLPFASMAAGKPAAPTGPAPIAGTDYVEIDGGQPYAPVAGKIEVVEVFGYTCPHCAHFQPLLTAWKARQAADVKLTPVAAPFGGYWVPYAKAFYTAETLGVLGQTHEAMFLALHTDGSLPIHDASTGEIAGFYARYGVDPQRFTATFSSPAIVARLNGANQFILRSGVDATPTLVVNGKYRVLGKNFEDSLRIAGHLIARERAGQRR